MRLSLRPFNSVDLRLRNNLIFAKGERIERETKTEEDLQDCNFKVTFVLNYEEWKESGLL